MVPEEEIDACSRKLNGLTSAPANTSVSLSLTDRCAVSLLSPYEGITFSMKLE